MPNIAETIALLAAKGIKRGAKGASKQLIAKQSLQRLEQLDPAAIRAPGVRAPQQPVSPPSGLMQRAPAGPKQRVQGTLGQIDNPDVVFEGTQPANFRPGQVGRFGEYYGAKMLGPTSTKKWQASLRPFETTTGRRILVPHGIESNEPFTYYDMAFLQSQGVNPNELLPWQHQKLHDRTVAGHQLASSDPETEKFNQLMLGLTSPNNPLTPNLLLMSRVMAKGPQDISRWAQLGHNLPKDLPKKEKFAGPVRDITEQFGIQAQGRGGLGVSGSHDYTMFPKFAETYSKDPQWFRFRGDLEHGDTEAEKWASYVERLMGQVKGLSAKTASFGGVWQMPRDAAISAVDRHMLDILGQGLFATPAEAEAFRVRVLAKFNKPRIAKNQKIAETLDDMAAMGGKSQLNDAQFAIVNAHKTMKFRDARTGEINKNVPKHLQEGWITEPTFVRTISPGYHRAVGAVQEHALETGQTGLFSSQWLQWDKQRNRLDPHLGIHPALSKLPRQSMAQLRGVRQTYKEAGYLSMAEKKAAKAGEEVKRTIPPVRPVSNASRLMYWTAPLLSLGAASQIYPDYRRKARPNA